MAKLEFSHQVIRIDRPKQEMIINVEYSPSDDSLDDIEVYIYENNVLKCEVSDLLDDAQGSPLAAMIESIDWRAIYRNSEHFEPEVSDYEVGDLMDRVDMER